MIDLANNNLEYLTVESIQWAISHVRPCMSLEEKRAKHRMHQRRFALRQRQRIKQLQRDLRQCSLQLKLLEASRDAAALISENEALEHQLSSDILIADSEKMLTRFDCDDSARDRADLVIPASEVAVILEMLDVLRDVHTTHADSSCEVEALTWTLDTESERLLWPTTYLSDKRFGTP